MMFSVTSRYIYFNCKHSMATLKNELVGSWELLSYIEISADGSDSFFPLGNSPKGTLIYAIDGYMSVQIVGHVDPSVKGISTNGLVANGGSRLPLHLIFSGPYHVDNDQAVVIHHITHSLNPALIDKDVERTVTFDADILYLKSVRPVLSSGKLVNSYMTWRRLAKFGVNQRSSFMMKFGSKRIKM